MSIRVPHANECLNIGKIGCNAGYKSYANTRRYSDLEVCVKYDIISR